MRQFIGVTVAGVAMLMAMGQTAAAQETDRWYVAAAGTISMPNSTEATVANAPVPGATVRTENGFGTGAGVQLAVGREIGDFRLELELGYTRDKQNRYVAIVPPTGRINADVTVKTKRAMINAYWDVTDGVVAPFVGAGAGVAEVDLLFIGPRAPFPTEAPRTLIDGKDSRFAYQLMTGLAWRVSDRVRVTGQYRWFDAGKPVINDIRNEATTRRHRGHHFDIGVRVAL